MPIGVTTVLDLIDRTVAEHPDAPAVWEAGRTVTYAELDRLADRAAARLRREHGLGVGDVVLVAAEAGAAFTAVVLGVLRAGGAYLPVDLSYPEQRKAYIMRVARAKLAVQPAGRPALGDRPATTLEALLADAGTGTWPGEPQPMARPALGAADISYLIFSSGSTGAPKCIIQTHGCLANYVAWQAAGSGLGTGRRVLQAAPLTFDVSVQEVFSTLASGGCLYVPGAAVRRDPRDLLEFIIEQAIEVVDFPQSLIDAIMRLPRTLADAPALRHIISAGETVRCDGELAALLARRPEVTLHNHYGPAENHMATAHSVSAALGNIEARPPVGSVIWNVYVYLLDEELNPVPDGEIGEVYIGGAGVGRGYTDPARTATAFVEDPFRPGARLYRTRDRGRWRAADGTLELLGRIDDLIKIRGNAVEPREVEEHLAVLPGAGAAMVFPHDRADGIRELHAVITGAAPAGRLREALLAVLPDYMVPVRWWSADTLPTTPNGKLDRLARPAEHGWRAVDGAAGGGVDAPDTAHSADAADSAGGLALPAPFPPPGDGGLAEAWIPRLAEVRGVPGLEPYAPAVPTATAGRIGAEATAALDRITGRQSVGLQLVAIAAAHLVLVSWDAAGRHAVLTGDPRPGRTGELAVAAAVDPGEPVAALLSRVHAEVEASAADAWTDRAALAARLAAAGLPDLAALAQIAVVCDGTAVPAGVPVLTVRRDGDGLVLHTSAPGGRIPVAAQALAPCVAAAMAAIAADPRRPCGDVDVLGAAQRAELQDWSALPVPAEFPALTLPGIVDDAAASGPRRPAVVLGALEWDHAELGRRTRRAAAVLRRRHGIGRGDRVALLLPRSPELVVAMIAVARTGASFIPLDPSHPPARLERQLALGGAVCVLSDLDEIPGGTTTPVIGSRELLDPADGVDDIGDTHSTEGTDDLTASAPSPDDEAVLFFTSGSTGIPRPVALTHRQLAYKAVSSGRRVGFDADTRCVLISAVSSDGTAYQVFTTLAAGGCLVPVDAVQRMEPADFWHFLREHRVDTVNCVPSLLATMAAALSESDPFALRLVMLGGDEIPPGLLPWLARRVRFERFANLYGPSETTVECVGFLRTAADAAEETGAVPIGKPSPGFGIVVLTPDGALAPVGVAGEIHILGPGVAAGYLDGEPSGPGRFVELEAFPGVRVFRTGDFGRWRADGELDFLGRRDGQLKINGNRIELGEIEAALAGVPGVRAAAAVAVPRPGAAPAIAAVYVAEVADADPTDVAVADPVAVADAAVTPDDVRAAVARVLPVHMVPGRLERLGALPLTPHGKVDRRAILALVSAGDDQVWDPADPAGQAVAKAWTEVLGTPARSGEEDLFGAGGNSLAAVLLAAALCRAAGADVVTVRQVFAGRTPEALAAVLRAADSADLAEPPIAAAEPLVDPGRTPASSAQRRMWFLESLDDGEVRLNNMVEAFRLPGGHTAAAVHDALRTVVGRHEALRTLLVADDDRLDQVVLDDADAALEFHDGTGSARPQAETQTLAQVIDLEQRRRAALDSGPVVRAYWIPGADAGTLVLSVHHSVCDGWSLSVIIRDLAEALAAPGSAPRPLPVQYRAASRRGQARWAGPDGARAREFWARELAGLPEVDLPLDRRRPLVRDSAAGAVRAEFSQAGTAALRALCAAAGTTLFTGFVAVVRVLMQRLCAADDVPLGTIVAGRDEPGLTEAVGLFANTAVLRTRVDAGAGFRSLLTAAARHADAVREFQEYPFELIAEAAGAARVAGRNPLFDVVVESAIVGTLPAGPDAAPGVGYLEPATTAAGFDLVLSFLEPAAGAPAGFRVTFRRDVFDQAGAERIAGQLRHLLDALAAAPDAPVGTVPGLPAGQRAELLALGTGPEPDFPLDVTALDLFQAQAAARPGAVAVVAEHRTLTYGALDAAAESVAARLRAGCATGPETAIAIVCRRDEWMVAALLGVWKTGSALVPLDPEQPPARIRGLIEAAGAVGVLADRTWGARLAGVGLPVLVLGEAEAAADEAEAEAEAAAAEAAAAAAATAKTGAAAGPGPEDLAYLIFTSGSTGMPKGVAVEHRPLAAIVQHRVAHYGLDLDQCVLQVDPFHFDAGIGDICSALAAGAKLVVPTRHQLLEPDAVAALIRRERVTNAMMVPSLYQFLVESIAPALAGVRQLALGGERVSEALVARHRELLPDTELHNEYGPTEDCVDTTVTRVDTETGPVTIGRPMPGKTIDLLDARGELVPRGAPGEICIGGVGLARGYRTDPALTARRFVGNPVRPGTRMYRTGDLGRWLPDGRLLYLGRADDQVKIRGTRIEPGEVAAVLAEAPGVTGAAVVARPGPDGGLRLVAYVVGTASPAALRAHLGARLPAAMVPEAFVALPRLPLTANGKLDRAALPDPVDEPVPVPMPPPASAPDPDATQGTNTVPAAGADQVAHSPAEAVVAQVFARVLGRPVGDLDASLFDLGGHSLSAARIGRELGVPVSAVFANQTIRALAKQVGADAGAGTAPGDLDPAASPAAPEPCPAPAPSHPQPAAGPMSRAQRRVWLASRRGGADAFLVSWLVRTGRSLDPALVRAALDAVVARQDMLRAAFRSAGTAGELIVLDRLPDGAPLVVHDLPDADPQGPDVAAALRAARAVGFDLRRAPLFQTRLLHGVAGGDILTVTAHHAIFDGASSQILLDDFFEAYGRAEAGADPALPQLGYTYRDFIADEQSWLSGPEGEEHQRFWKDRLAGAGEAPDLVDGRRRGPVRGGTGFARRVVDPPTAAAATPFAIVVTAFSALVHRLTGTTDLVLGFAAGLRHHPGAEELVGYLANAVPLRVQPRPAMDLGTLLAHVQERIGEALDHARLPFDALVDHQGLRAAPGRSVLLDLGVSWENATVGPEAHVLEDLLPEQLPATSDAWLYASLRDGRLHLDLTYDDAMLTAAEAESLADQLTVLVAEVAARPGTAVSATPAPAVQEPENPWSGTRYDF